MNSADSDGVVGLRRQLDTIKQDVLQFRTVNTSSPNTRTILQRILMNSKPQKQVQQAKRDARDIRMLQMIRVKTSY